MPVMNVLPTEDPPEPMEYRVPSSTTMRRVTPMKGHPDLSEPPAPPPLIPKKEGVVEYSECATMHGVYYVFERNVFFASRIFWGIMCLGLASLAFYWIWEAYTDWQNNPVLTTVKTTALPVEQIEFPAITICGLGLIESTLDRAFLKQVETYITEKTGKAPEINEDSAGEDLLEEYDLFDDFIKDYYPGTKKKTPTDLAKAIVSHNPDSLIESVLYIEGYDPCDDVAYSFEEEDEEEKRRRKRSADNATATANATCPEGFTIAGSFCLKWPGAMAEFEGRYEHCDPEGGEPFFLLDNTDLIKVHAALKTEPLKSGLSSGLGFYADIYRDDDRKFYRGEDGLEITATNFPMIEVKDSGDKDKTCMYLKMHDTNNTFVGVDVFCHEAFPTLCLTWAEVPFDFSQCPPRNATSSAVKKRRKRSDEELEGGELEQGEEGEEEGDEEGDEETKLDLMMNPEKSASTAKSVALLKKSYREAFSGINLTASYPKLFELLWYSQIPCFDVKGFTSDQAGKRSLLKKCFWKGKEMPCSSIFYTFPTDRGMCCTFNLEAADEMFQKTTFRDTLEELQGRDANFSFESSKPPSTFESGTEPTPDTGTNKGLFVILDAHTDLVSQGSVREDFQGFIAMVDRPKEYPVTRDRHIRIRPGHDNLVAITATDITTEGGFQSLSYEDRECYFSYEREHVNIFKNYSQPKCRLECELKYAREKLQEATNKTCTPWYLPVAEGSLSICDPWDAIKFEEFWADVPRNTCSKCLSDCSTTLYSSILTALPFRRCDNKNLGVSKFCDLKSTSILNPPIFGANIRLEYENNQKQVPSYIADKFETSIRRYTSDANKDREIFLQQALGHYDAYEKDIASVHFYFDKPTLLQYGRKPRLTWISFFSQMGGLLGLCLGFSICSLVEIVYWLFIRIWFHFKKEALEEKHKARRGSFRS